MLVYKITSQKVYDATSRPVYTHDSLRCHVAGGKVVNRNAIGTSVQGSKSNRLKKINPRDKPIDPTPIETLAK